MSVQRALVISVFTTICPFVPSVLSRSPCVFNNSKVALISEGYANFVVLSLRISGDPSSEVVAMPISHQSSFGMLMPNGPPSCKDATSIL